MIKHIFNSKMVSKLLPFSLTVRENQLHLLLRLHSVPQYHADRRGNWGPPSIGPFIIIYVIVEVPVSQTGMVLGAT